MNDSPTSQLKKFSLILLLGDTKYLHGNHGSRYRVHTNIIHLDEVHNFTNSALVDFFSKILTLHVKIVADTCCLSSTLKISDSAKWWKYQWHAGTFWQVLLHDLIHTTVYLQLLKIQNQMIKNTSSEELLSPFIMYLTQQWDLIWSSFLQ